jgi:hypothetical protein
LHEGDFLFHTPNILFKVANMVGVGGSAAAAGAAAVVAEATKIATVPAWGIFGWTGMATTATIPIAGAAIAAVFAPLAIVLAVAASVMYPYQSRQWKKKMIYLVPRKHGLPKGGVPRRWR